MTHGGDILRQRPGKRLTPPWAPADLQHRQGSQFTGQTLTGVGMGIARFGPEPRTFVVSHSNSSQTSKIRPPRHSPLFPNYDTAREPAGTSGIVKTERRHDGNLGLSLRYVYTCRDPRTAKARQITIQRSAALPSRVSAVATSTDAVSCSSCHTGKRKDPPPPITRYQPLSMRNRASSRLSQSELGSSRPEQITR